MNKYMFSCKSSKSSMADSFAEKSKSCTLRKMLKMIKMKSVSGLCVSKKDKSKWGQNAKRMKSSVVANMNLLDILLLSSVANEGS